MKQFNNIRLFREFKGYSQKYVALKLRKSQSAFSKIENRITHISDKMLEQLSEILEVPKEELFTDAPLLISGLKNDDFDKLKKLSAAKTIASLPVNDIIPVLFSQLVENKKLLCEVQSNQEELPEHLNLLLAIES